MDNRAVESIALTVRTLTMDATSKAGSGHPGMPMGVAELGAVLYGEVLNLNPGVPDWVNRDRAVLSAGHECLLLFSLLHLAGFDISLEDIKNFRQLGSKAAGHPEYGLPQGLETTTGPLGQGFANAVGMAIAESMLAARFNTADHKIIDHYTYAISGDGCMMEGVTSEAASLAGHLGLGKLIVFYDANRITIEGSTDLAFSEDVAGRFEAYGWHVQKGDAYDAQGILRMVDRAKSASGAPSLIMLSSIIAKGSPNMEGSHEAHGAPLGDAEIRLAKKAMGVDEETAFYIHPAAVAHFEERRRSWEKAHAQWQKTFEQWSRANPDLYRLWQSYFSPPDLSTVQFPGFEVGDSVATRSAGGKVLNAIARAVPNLIGGSADLAPSNKTYLDGMGDIGPGSFDGRNFHFGVREHAMGAIANGLALHGGLMPFCATFFVFSDYMRPPMRLAAMMELPVIYVFTHDSIYVGEDGPTHQPVEQLAAIRSIPGMVLLRPADAQETLEAWKMAIAGGEGPTALVLSRQNLEVFEKQDGWRESLRKGAYVAQDSEGEPKVVVIATGSEVSLALQAAKVVADPGVRVVSMISRELYERQPEQFKAGLVPPSTKRLVVEAGVAYGWDGLAGLNGAIHSIQGFGESGPYKDVAAYFGFTPENIAEKIKNLLR